MIVDCHAHAWDCSDQLGRLSLAGHHRACPPATGRQLSSPDISELASPDYRDYQAAAAGTTHTIILGFRSRYLGADIPAETIANFVADDPDRYIGFAGVDPNDRFALDDIQQAVDLGLRGLTLSPATQDFHPTDTRAMQVYERACRLNLPIVFHQGGHLAAQSKMEYARPFLLDEVARNFPDLRLVISHLGYPWVDETVVMLDKHPHVYADICSLVGRPWQAYQCLSLCSNAGVTHKLLFGSDFPNSTVQATIKALYSLNELTRGTNLPSVPMRELRGIVERESLELLNLTKPSARCSSTGASSHAEIRPLALSCSTASKL